MGAQLHKFFFLLSHVLVLSGCLSTHGIDKQQVKQCILRCEQRLDNCLKKCHDHCENCIRKSNLTTENSYDRYINEQKIQGAGVIRQLNSYRDPLKCRKLTCNCKLDYKLCSNLCYSPQH